MESATLDQWARESETFKSIMEEVIYARYRVAMSLVKGAMALAQCHITNPDARLTHEQREVLLKVLNGEIVPPK